jgi:hypothetical protein
MEQIITALAQLETILNSDPSVEGLPYNYKIELQMGKVYARIVRREVWHHNPTEPVNGSVYGFIKLEDLTLWKAAGWKASAKNKARGVLSDLTDAEKVLPMWRYSIS